MNLDEIARIAQLMSDHDLSEFQVESEDLKLTLKRGATVVAQAAPTVALAPSNAAPAAPPSFGAGAAAGEDSDDDLIEGATINSPIVGTFYNAPAPDAPAFVKAGDRVSADTVVCIIEAMKVMNEIRAEHNGVIRRVMVENATSVEFGQPMFELELC